MMGGQEFTFYRWNSVNEFFAALNESGIKYVVLRNWEEMHTSDFFCGKHEDIDMLVESSEKFEKVAHAYRKMWPEDDIHYVIFAGKECIPVDVRHVGDNYYDNRWEKEMLDRRVMAENGNWYVLNQQDYYHTLGYHAIFQKMAITEDYVSKLNSMAKSMGYKASTVVAHIEQIDVYMQKNGYKKVKPEDQSVPFMKSFELIGGGSNVLHYNGVLSVFLKQEIKQTSVWKVLRQKRYDYYRLQYDKGSESFKDLRKLSLKLQRKYGEDVYTQLAQKRVYKYINRYDKEIKSQYQHLSSRLKLKKQPNLESPVFAMWQQGRDEAPMVIKACLNSIEALAIKRNKEFILLNDENLKDYLDIPSYILEKYNKKEIGNAHFSDLVRLFAIATYGGTWIDSSCFIPNNVPDYMVNDFFVFSQSPQLHEVRSYGNWWISAKPCNELLLHTLAMLLVYWKHEDVAFHYYIFHVFWKKAIDENVGCQTLIKDMPVRITDATHLLLQAYTKEYDKETWEEMKRISPVFKCSYKAKGFTSQNSFYCRLCEGRLD